MRSSFKSLILLTGIFTSCHVFATNDITGTWRNIDDKTGFSKGIVEITRTQNGTYEGKIIDITPRPGYTPKEICDKCKGENRNKQIIGLKVLKNIKRSGEKPNQFVGGTILDPLSGQEYKTSLRLNNDGSRLALRGYIGVEALGRSQTWLRVN